MTARAIVYLHATSPIQVGTGQALDVIDLPIQRERGTELPIVAGSAVKGVIRAEEETKGDDDFVASAFGNENNPTAGAGAVTFGDARLLLFPVRSVRLLFAWVTCPYLLRRYAWDRHVSGLGGDEERRALEAVARAGGDGAWTPDDSLFVPTQPQQGVHQKGTVQKGKVYIEDADLPAQVLPELAALAKSLANRCLPDLLRTLLSDRLLVVSDTVLGNFVRQCTEITPRNKLKDKEKTSDNLWYEEALPAETILYSALLAEETRGRQARKFSGLEHLAKLSGIHSAQFGGKASVGRGLCNLSWETAS